MAVMSIRIDDKIRKALKIIASIEGKSMGGIVSDLIEEYIRNNAEKIKAISEYEHLREIMNMSENAFREWDNEEDEIYNNL